MNAVVGIAGLEKLSRHYLDLYRSLRIDTARLESDVRPDSADAAPRIRQLYRTLTDLSNNQALELADLAGPHPSEELAAAFRATDLQRRILLQSAFIRRALEKPRGYAGDMELMLMICKRGDVGETFLPDFSIVSISTCPRPGRCGNAFTCSPTLWPTCLTKRKSSTLHAVRHSKSIMRDRRDIRIFTLI